MIFSEFITTPLEDCLIIYQSKYGVDGGGCFVDITDENSGDLIIADYVVDNNRTIETEVTGNKIEVDHDGSLDVDSYGGSNFSTEIIKLTSYASSYKECTINRDFAIMSISVALARNELSFYACAPTGLFTISFKSSPKKTDDPYLSYISRTNILIGFNQYETCD
jgi:hypothetical protein